MGSIMGSRRRSRERSKGRSGDLWDELDEAAEYEAEQYTPERIKERFEATAREQAKKKELAEKWWSGERWEEMGDYEKSETLATTLDSFLLKHNFDAWRKFLGSGFFTSESVFNEQRRHIGRDASIRWDHGKGYRDIELVNKALEKDRHKSPEEEEKARILIGRIRELDAHDGMTPKEYRASQKQAGPAGPVGGEAES